MEDEHFNELALKVLGGEASAEETARLHELVRSNSEYEREFDQLRAAWRTLRDVLPLAQAMDAPPCDVPPRILIQLQDRIRKRVGAGEVQSFSIQVEKIPGGSRDAAEPVAGREKTHSAPVALRGAFRNWLTNCSKVFGLSDAATFGVLALALAVIFGVIGLCWLGQRAHPTMSPRPIEAYLIVKLGQAQVLHSNKYVPVGSSAPLAARDKVRLAAGAIAELVTERQQIEVVGPKDFSVDEAVGNKLGSSTSKQSAVESSSTDKAMRTALFGSVNELNSSGLLVTTRDHRPIALYSPLGVARTLSPVIRWKNEPGKVYDLEIIDEFPPKSIFLRLSRVVSPVDLAKPPSLQGKALADKGLYRIILKVAANPLSASEFTFETRDTAVPQNASSPSESLTHACQLVTAKPSRASEALEDLLSLPSPWGQSQLALRLKLFVFGQLGYAEEFDAVKAELLELHDAQ